MKKTDLIPALFVVPLLLTLVLLPVPASAGHDAPWASRGWWSGHDGGHHDHGSSRVTVRGAFVFPPLFPFAFVAPPPVIGIAGPWRGHDRHDGWDSHCHRPDHRHWGRHRHDHHDRDRDFDGHGWRR